MSPRNARKRKFAAELANGKTQTQAAIDAGYSEIRAAAQGSILAKDPDVQANLRAIFAKQGLTDSTLAKHIKKGLNESEVEGKHGDYVDRLGRYLGHDVKRETAVTNQILIVQTDQAAASSEFLE